MTEVTVAADVEAADRAAVEAAYVRYWEVYQSSPEMSSEERGIKFAEVATGPELEVLHDAADRADRYGLRFEGAVTNRFEWWKPVNGENWAAFTNCQDQSQLKTFKEPEGKVVMIGPERGRVDITFAKGADGVWRVSAVVYPGTPC